MKPLPRPRSLVDVLRGPVGPTLPPGAQLGFLVAVLVQVRVPVQVPVPVEALVRFDDCLQLVRLGFHETGRPGGSVLQKILKLGAAVRDGAAGIASVSRNSPGLMGLD